jgi:hypothetical protein
MRNRYILGGEKEEPFLESVLHSDGCLLSERGGGQIFVNRPILPSEGTTHQNADLYDNIVTVTGGWRVFHLTSRPVVHSTQLELHQTLKALSFMDVSYVPIGECQDFEGHYRSFLGEGWNLALVRPDQYVFAFFKDLDDLYNNIHLIKTRLCIPHEA